MASDAQKEFPAHIAIVMDGNGRWAQQRSRPRSMGHQAGLKALRRVVEHCGRIGVRELTVFAFSSENWNRPEKEVSRLMELFMRALDREANELHQNGVSIRFIGDLSRFAPELQDKIRGVLARTPDDCRVQLNVAANYGGRWDITNAARALAAKSRRARLTRLTLTRPFSNHGWPPPGAAAPTCLSAPVAKPASAISCSGRRHTANCTSHLYSGQILARPK